MIQSKEPEAGAAGEADSALARSSRGSRLCTCPSAGWHLGTVPRWLLAPLLA
jgi:hypothetical protein